MLLLYLKLMEMIEKAPIIFSPYFKSVIWGGNKICAYKGIDQQEPNIGESWEISAVPGHESVVADGTYKGLNLVQLIQRYGADSLGTEVMSRYDGMFPLLVKLIDANDNLSVQVHPDDTLAKQRHDSLGKTEMWYIIQADKGAKIYAGLNTEMSPDDYVKRVAENTFADTLATHNSESGDVFFLPAGRVHAIGAGNLLAEIQESSDITYRIYDYDRRDSNGNTRELHTELAKDAIDYTVYSEYKSPRAASDVADCEIVKCDHFITNRVLLEGDATLKYSMGEMNIKAGQTVLLPAAMTSLSVTGKGLFLKSRAV